jgi:hypothetical protein
VVAGGQSTWTYTPTLPATAGTSYFITARVADAAGNFGTASAACIFVLDTTAPAVAVTSSARSTDTTPVISGTAEAGAQITLTIGGATYQATATNGIWSVDTDTAIPTSGSLAIGSVNAVVATACDTAGNSASVNQTLLIYFPIELSAVAAGSGGFVINGQSAGDFSGRSVSAAGDVNGDGLADLLVGAPLSDPAAGREAGRSYVVFGSTAFAFAQIPLDWLGTIGNDTRIGGLGSDTFRFTTTPGPTNRDLITDFSSAVDKLSFSKSVFTGFGAQTTLTADQFAAGAGLTAATNINQRFLYDTTSGILRFDSDGSATGASALEVALLGSTTHPTLVAADCLLS